MPNPLHSVQTADRYSDACSILDVFRSNGGSFDIDGASIFYQLQYGGQGDTHFTEEVEAKPGAGLILPDTTGIRFRSKVAGMPATVSAVIAPHAQPYAAISSSASASTAPASTLNGQIDPAGNIVAGTGFTAARTGTGVYIVTYGTPSPFSSAANVQVTPNTGDRTEGVTVSDNLSFTVELTDHTNAAANGAFTFTATPFS